MTPEEIQAEIDAVRARRRHVRAVIDNNVLVSGLLWGDKTGRVLAGLRRRTNSDAF